MQQVRQMEGAAAQLYLEKVIRGFLHLYSGQVSNIYTDIPYYTISNPKDICYFH